MPHVGHARAIPEEGSKGPLLLGFSSFTWLFLPRILTLQTLQYITKSPRWLELTLTKYFFLKFHNHEIMKLIGRRNNLLLHAVETSLNNLCILPCPVDPFLRVESKTLMMRILLGRRPLGLHFPLQRRRAPEKLVHEGAGPPDEAPKRPSPFATFGERGDAVNGPAEGLAEVVVVGGLRPQHFPGLIHGLFLLSGVAVSQTVSHLRQFFFKPRTEPSARGVT
jgi:hypothetical protein